MRSPRAFSIAAGWAGAALLLLTLMGASSVPQPNTPLRVRDNASLAKLSAKAVGGAGGGVWRESVATMGDAPPLYFVSQVNTCGHYGLANDKGSCVDAFDANSWLAVYPGGRYDVRQFGAKGDGTTDDITAIQAAISAAADTQYCIYIPYTTAGYKISAAITFSTSATNPYCVTGDALVAAQAKSTAPGFLLHTTDTSCIVGNGRAVSIYNISCVGNGNTSSSATATVCIDLSVTNGFDTRVQNVNCTGYVTCIALTDRTRGANVSCDESSKYPNLVNDYPSYCVHNKDNAGNVVEVIHITGLFCRGQSFGTTTDYTGDGSTTFFDMTLNATSGIPSQASVMWSADSMRACYALTSADRYPCVPLVAGTDYTVWDCGASPCGGTGGTQLLVKTLTASTTSGNPQITVASTTGLSAGTQYKAIAEHNLLEPSYVVSIDDATHLTLSNAPTSTNSKVKYTFTQVNVSSVAGNISCRNGTTPTCGHNIEIRLTFAPAGGFNLEVVWQDPWQYVGIYDEKGAEAHYDVSFMGGIRTIYQSGCVGCYGNSTIDVTYWEHGNYCAVIDEGAVGGYTGVSTGNTIRVGRNVRPPTIIGTNMRCPMWFDPKGINNKLFWNGSDWRVFEGSNQLAANVSLNIGSDTAPINTAAGKLEIDFSNVTCSGGTSNLNLKGSEDGTTMLGGTNYQYYIQNDKPSGSVTAISSTGNSALVFTTGSLDTAGANGGRITINGPGLSATHGVGINLQMVDSTAANHNLMGGGFITGTPAPLKALQINCGSAGTVLLGQFRYREVW